MKTPPGVDGRIVPRHDTPATESGASAYHHARETVGVSELPLTVVVAPGAKSTLLAHACGAAGEAVATVYTIRPGVAERLGRGERVPVTARCRGCDGRVFANLVGPEGERAPHAATVVRIDPAVRPPRPSLGAPRPPARGPTRPIPLDRYRREAPEVREEAQPEVEVCPACGVRPDDLGRCRCSL